MLAAASRTATVHLDPSFHQCSVTFDWRKAGNAVIKSIWRVIKIFEQLLRAPAQTITKTSRSITPT
jgi:hypothetical protein